MNAVKMIELLNRHPFEPLEMHLSNGTVIVIEHPYLIATAPGSSQCIIHGEVESEPTRYVSYRNIVEVKCPATISSGEA